MQNLFDVLNASLLRHPEALAYLHFLFRLKSCCLILLMGIFLFLIYREDWRNHKASRQTNACRLVA